MTELIFPLTVHYKVIVQSEFTLSAERDVVMILEHYQYSAGLLEMGNVSSSGKYQTINLSLYVPSQEQMNDIDRRLREIAGVKIVL